ncbi:MAG: TlpA family protein disulfide reductase [Pirellulales bacterium]|nr:TlpA family protein disulfide reductase [Pirellulales bacterium]
MTIRPTHTIWFACWVLLVALVVPFAQIRAADDAPAAEAAPATETPAAAPAERIEQIRSRTEAAVATARGDRAQLVAAYKARRAELAALANEAEAGDPSKLTVADHRALADVYSRDLQRPDDAARHAQAALDAEPADPQAWAILINAQASNPNTLTNAEASLAKAAQVLTPEQVAPLHAAIASWQMRGRQHRAAGDHLAAFLELGRGQLLGQGQPAGSYVRRVEQAVAAYGSAKAEDVALKLIERELAALGTDEARQGKLASPQVVAELTALKIRQLVRMGQTDAGRALLDESLRNARSAYDAAPEDAAALQALLPFARLEWEQSRASAPSADASAAAQPALYLQLLGKVLKDDKVDAAVRRATTEAALAAGLQLLSDDNFADADVIAKHLGEALVPEAEPPAAAAAARVPIDSLQNQVRSFIRRVASEQARMALIGQPAFPLETDAWVNGDPLTDEDLKGKIVLLDFWAVWCGPCIACFPHLRDWHEKYADRGLVIIGLTKYYKYGWDAAAGRGTKIDDITPEDERGALVQFAAHYELKHRLAYMPEGATLSQRYGVTGIPQMVLIDREGKVRMIRVGSGEANAHDLETLIEELLASPTSTAGSGNETEAATPAESTP